MFDTFHQSLLFASFKKRLSIIFEHHNFITVELNLYVQYVCVVHGRFVFYQHSCYKKSKIFHVISWFDGLDHPVIICRIHRRKKEPIEIYADHTHHQFSYLKFFLQLFIRVVYPGNENFKCLWWQSNIDHFFPQILHLLWIVCPNLVTKSQSVCLCFEEKFAKWKPNTVS